MSSEEPQGTFGRGGGGNFMKKSKPAPSVAPTSINVHTLDPEPDEGGKQPKEKEAKSMFKRLSLGISRRSTRKEKGREREKEKEKETIKPPPGALPGRTSWEAYAPSPMASTFSSSQTPAQQMVLDISRSSQLLNLDTITPGSSEDGDSFHRRIADVTSHTFAPGSMTSNTETTAVNDLPLNFPKSGMSLVDEPLSPRPSQYERLQRSRSLVERARPVTLGVHFERTRPPIRVEHNRLSGADYPFTSNLSRHESYQRGRRITLGAPPAAKNIPPPLPIHEPTSRPRTHTHTHTHCCEDHKEEAAQKTTPHTPEEAYNNLFGSAAISLFLLIILAAGKDVLYLLALLPFLSALVKHVDFTNLPIVKRYLQSLVSV